MSVSFLFSWCKNKKTTANGVRVAAEDNNDSTTCVGLGIDVGARLETKEEQGMSALLKRMLLTGRFSQQLERLGASLVRSDVSCRDSIYVAAEVLRPHAKVGGLLVCVLLVHRLVGPLASLLAGGPLLRVLDVFPKKFLCDIFFFRTFCPCCAML